MARGMIDDEERWIDMKRSRNGGFTLLEVIVCLTLGAMVGVLLVQMMGTSLVRSGEVVHRSRDHFNLMDVADKLTASYKKLTGSSGTPLATFKALIDGGTFHGAGYTFQTKYIGFDPGTNTELAAPQGSTILKVTITNTKDGQKLVALFTQ